MVRRLIARRRPCSLPPRRPRDEGRSVAWIAYAKALLNRAQRLDGILSREDEGVDAGGLERCFALARTALERAGLLEEEPYRRGHRVRILGHALEPLAQQLPGRLRERLHHALSVIYGIESYMVLKDIWGLSDREIERTALWMADAMVDAALREAGDGAKNGTRRRRAKTA